MAQNVTRHTLLVLLLLSGGKIAASESSLDALLARADALTDWQNEQRLALTQAGLQAARADTDAWKVIKLRALQGKALINLGRLDDARRSVEQCFAAAAAELPVAAQRCRINRSIIAIHTGEFADAAAILETAFRLESEHPNAELLWRMHNIRGVIHLRLGEHSAAVGSFQAALPQPDGARAQLREATLLNNIAVAYMSMRDNQSALNYLHRAREAAQEAGDLFALSSALGNLADVSGQLQAFEEAEAFYAQALALRLKLGNQEKVALSHRALARLMNQRGHYEQAAGSVDQAIAIERDLGLEPALAYSLLTKSDSLIGLERYEQALTVTEEGLRHAQELGLADIERDAQNLRAEILERLGRAGQALAAWRETVALTELARDKHAQATLAQFEAKFKVRDALQKVAGLEQEKALQALRLQHNDLRQNTLIGVVVAAILLAFLGWRRYAISQTSNARLERANRDLNAAIAKIKTLEGLLPICMHCKKIRNEHQNWTQLEAYITQHSQAEFSHGICPECIPKYLRSS